MGEFERLIEEALILSEVFSRPGLLLPPLTQSCHELHSLNTDNHLRTDSLPPHQHKSLQTGN